MQFVRYAVHDHVADIALARPPVNALNGAVLDELIECLRRAADDDAVRVVTLRSALAGRFCAGIDLHEVATMSPDALHALIDTLYLGLHDAQTRLAKPSIAVVNGTARGGGMTVAISCDLIVAARRATFGYPEIDLGVIPAIHYAHLAGVVGRHRAFDLLFTGRSFGADEAVEMGLVSAAVDDAQLNAQVDDLARTLAAKPSHAVRAGRAAFRHEVEDGYRERVARAVENFCAVAATDEARDGMRRFAARRRA